MKITTELAPFDLAKAKAGAKIETAGGQSARLIATDIKHPYYNVIALVCDDNIEEPHTYTEQGKFDKSGRDNIMDLYLKNKCAHLTYKELCELLEVDEVKILK